MAPRAIRLLLCLLLALALASVADAGLKKRKRALTLGEVSRKLEKYEGTKLAPGEVRYTTFGDPDFDRFSRKAAEIRLLGTFANRTIRDANRKLDGADSEKDLDGLQENLDLARKCLDHIQKAAPDLADSGEALLRNLPAKALEDPQGYARHLEAMKEILADGVRVASRTPGEAAKLLDRLARVGAKVARKKARLR